MQLLDMTWRKLSDATYKIGRYEFNVDSLTSGEFITLAFNSITNLVYGTQMNTYVSTGEPELSAVRWRYDLIHKSFMGDDAIYIYGCMTAPTAREISFLRDSAVKVAVSDGLALKMNKVDISHGDYEYLKVDIKYGYLLERSSILQLLGSEKKAHLQSPIDVMLSYKQFMLTAIKRGFNVDALFRLYKATWLFARKVRGRSRHKYYPGYLPYYSLYVPICLKGVGCLVDSLFGSNVDAIIAYRARGRFRRALNYTAEVLRNLKSTARRDLARRALKTGLHAAGIEYLKENMNPKKAEWAADALSNLDKFHVKIPVHYLNAPEKRIEIAVRDSNRLAGYDFEKRAELVQKHISQYVPLKSSSYLNVTDYIHDKIPWVRDIEFVEGPVLDKKLTVSYIPGLDPLLRERYMQIGYSTGAHAVVAKVERILGELRRDPEFPSFMTSEYIISVLSDPKVTGNPDLMASSLIALGIDPRVGAKIVAEFGKIFGLRALMDKMSYFSLGDAVSVEFNVGRIGRDRFVTVPEMNPRTADLFSSLCALYEITKPLSEPVRHVRLRANIDMITTLRYDNAIKFSLLTHDAKPLPEQWY
jgi:hypothetical protein